MKGQPTMFISRRALSTEPLHVPLPAIGGLEPFDQVLARLLDRQADHALHLGFYLQAERLAQRAAELRGAL